MGIQSITLSITYSPLKPPTENITISIGYEGCGFCDLCGGLNYTLSNGDADCGEGVWGSGSRSFQDPIPKGAKLVQVTIVTSQVFWCDNSVSVLFSLENTEIGTITSDYQDCGCDSCPLEREASSKYYKTGFPSYLYRYANNFLITPNYGNIGVRRIHLILTYETNERK